MKDLPSSNKGNTRRFFFLHCLILITAIIAVYGNSLRGEFVFDDFLNIVGNENIKAQSLTFDELKSSIYGTNPNETHINRPLAFLTLAINHAIGGLNPFGYHVFNIAVHIVCALLLYLVCLRLLAVAKLEDHRDTCLLAALLWAIHPLQVTGVTYLIQRMASLAALFTLAALYCYIRGRGQADGRAKWFTLAAITTIGAMASKENSILIPASLVLTEIIFFTPDDRRRKTLLLATSCMAIYGAAAILYLSSSNILSGYDLRPFTLSERLLTQPRVIFFYLSQIIYPLSDRYTLLHDFDVSRSLLIPPSTLAAIIGLLILAGLAIRYHRRHPLFSFAILFFLINHLVESTILPLELVYEHRNYLPSMFLYLLVALGMQRLIDYFSYRRSIHALAVITTVVLVFSIGHTTIRRNKVFRNEYTLWTDNIRKAPYLSRPHNNLGAWYWDRGYTEPAFRESSMAVNLNKFSRLPLAAVAHENIGMYYLQTKKMYKEALLEFQRSHDIAKANTHPRTWYGMAIASLKLGKLDDADRFIKKGLALMPDFPEMLLVQGMIFVQSGQIPKALKCFHRAASQNENDSRAYMALAATYMKLEENRKALNLWKTYVAINPDNPVARLAILELAAGLGDKELTNQSIDWIESHRNNDSWEEYIKETSKRQDDISIYSPDPDQLVPIIRDALEGNRQPPSF